MKTEIIRILQNHTYPLEGKIIVESRDFNFIAERVLALFASQDKWISVENRTPEITMKTSSDWVLTFDKINCRIDKAFFSNVSGWQAEHGEKMNVTYWMELPNPPITYYEGHENGQYWMD